MKAVKLKPCSSERNNIFCVVTFLLMSKYTSRARQLVIDGITETVETDSKTINYNEE